MQAPPRRIPDGYRDLLRALDLCFGGFRDFREQKARQEIIGRFGFLKGHPRA